MRNLFQFFVRYSSLFIFIMLEGVSLTLAIRYHSYHRTSFVNAANHFAGNVFNSYHNFTEYLSLKTVNDSLVRENALLKARQLSSFRDECVSIDSVKNEDLTQIYAYIGAKVINKTTDKANNYILLNRGSRHGIKRDMGVIAAQGVVGVVIDASDHFSVVMPVLHKDSKTSVKIGQSAYTGSLQWQGPSPYYADVLNVPNHVKVKTGDTVYTSGYSSIYPEDIMVGVIKKHRIPSGSNFHEITVKLSTNFEALPYVYVVNYLLKQEQQALEDSTKL
ncbi:MAG: rod shape-determining protein MreC [Chitinophagales bacterium]|nr:rod shape-determining protein MreC [Chitinophagales bacterium]